MPPLSCQKFEIYDVRAFVSHKKSLKFSISKPQEIHFEERSKAEFENNIENKKLHQVVEEIRNIIKHS